MASYESEQALAGIQAIEVNANETLSGTFRPGQYRGIRPETYPAIALTVTSCSILLFALLLFAAWSLYKPS